MVNSYDVLVQQSRQKLEFATARMYRNKTKETEQEV